MVLIQRALYKRFFKPEYYNGTMNVRLIYGINFLNNLIFFFPVLALYLENELFTLTNVALFFSFGAIMQTVLEVPTGIVADRLGRKHTLILSQLFFVLDTTLLVIGGHITVFLASAFFHAISRSLWSGTMDALLYDSLKSTNEHTLYKKVSGKSTAIAHMAIALSAVMGGYLAAVSLSLPIILTLIPVMLGLLLTFFVVEPRYHKDSDAYTHVKQSFKSFIGNKQIVLIATGILLIAAVFDSFNALNPVWYSFKNVPIEMFGWITSILFVLASVGYHESHRFAQHFGDKHAIMLTTILPPITVLSATFFDRYTAIFFVLLSPIFFGLRQPILDHIVHKQTKSKNRATIMSIIALMKRLGQAVFVLIMGHLADLYTINVAYQAAAILLFIVPIVYSFLDA